MPYQAFNVDSAEYEPLPSFGGAQAILHRSADGRRLAGSFKESGTYSHTVTFDEFIYVIAGTAKIIVDGGEPLELRPGSCLYLEQGSHVVSEYSPDFHDVAVLVSDEPISY